MEKIYSKVNPNILLHIIHRLEDLENTNVRENLISEENFIQCSSLNLKKGSTFKPHYHIWNNNEFESKRIAQESWSVVRGSVRCIFYDIDKTELTERILKAGDASFTLEGGHNYEILEEGSLIREYKTGPYFGQNSDKKFI